MTSIVEFFDRQKRRVDTIVDETFFRLTQDQEDAINQIFPIVNYPDRELLLLKMVKHMTAGYFVSEEQDIPAVRPRSTLREELIGNQKIAKRHVFTARDFELMNKMELYMSATGPRAAGMVDEINRYFFGVTADLVPALQQIFTWIMFQVVTKGSVDYTDPLTGYKVQLTYPNLISALFPAALTGNDAWTQPSTANGLRNLEQHAEDWFNEFGMWPNCVVLRWQMIRDLAAQETTKNAYLSMSGIRPATDNDLSTVYIDDDPVVEMIQRRTRCQKVVLIDAQIEIENADGTITPKYYLEDNTYTFLQDGNQERAIVPSVEKDFEQGVYTLAEVQNKAPRREQVLALQNSIPYVKDDRKLAARKVA